MPFTSLFPFTAPFQRALLLYLSLFLLEVIFPPLALLVLLLTFKPLSLIMCHELPSHRPVFSILSPMFDFLCLGVLLFVFCFSPRLCSSLFFTQFLKPPLPLLFTSIGLHWCWELPWYLSSFSVLSGALKFLVFSVS